MPFPFIFYTLFNDVERRNRKDKKMFKNLTPHTVNIALVSGELVLEPLGELARVSTIEEPDGFLDGVEIFNLTYGQVEGLPDPIDGTYYVVSKMVYDACPNRDDLFYPTRLLRDDAGKIVGCGGLAH